MQAQKTVLFINPGFSGVRSMGPVVSYNLRPRPFADLTDVTLVNDDTKSTLTHNANRAIQGNRAMHVTQGRHPNKKNFLIRALPELPPRPPPPNSGNFIDFFRPTKTTFCAYDGKKTDDDDNCCRDNFDQNFDNFDDNDAKKY